MFIEVIGHVLGVVDTYTKAESLYLIHVSDISVYTLKYKSASLAVGSVDFLELTRIIFAMNPLTFPIIDLISDTEILEGAEQISVDCFPQKHFRGDPSVKVFENILAIHAVRRCRQTKEDLRIVVGKQLLIGFGCRVVEFVNADIVIEIL